MNIPNILDNLQKLQALIEAQPEQTVDLRAFRFECGTIFCGLGHVCNDPYFQSLGFGWYDGTPDLEGILPWWPEAKTDDIFGPDAYDNLFAEKSYQTGHVDDAGQRGHKQVILDRIVVQIKLVKEQS